MTFSKIVFDDHYEMIINIPEQDQPVTLSISDDLDAAYKPLSKIFQEKIIDFLNKSSTWYDLGKKKINHEFSKDTPSRLLTIYILSENLEEDIIFGLLYRIEEDIEHGRGIKITSNMEIIEYGIGDVAIC